MKPIFITGKDWETCYLQLPESIDRKIQVLDDLGIEVEQRQECFQKGDIFCIDVLDHSSAYEMFEVKEITDDRITFIYSGGAS